MKLDDIDLNVLAQLHLNGRLTNRELAERSGIAASTCLERVRRLQQSGVIRGYHADISYSALGLGLEALVSVRLNLHSYDLIQAFRDKILKRNEVDRIYHIGGNNDFMIHVAVCDAAKLKDFIFGCLTADEGVAHVETALVFEWESGRGLPLSCDSDT